MAEGRKTVADIIIDRFLKDVDEKESMPWQRPYERYNAFNYFTKIPYRGINRLILPFGEYITKNQIQQYNKEKGYLIYENGKFVGMKPEAYRFVKGIQWIPVVFFKREVKDASLEEFAEEYPDRVVDLTDEGRFVGRIGAWSYRVHKGGLIKDRKILRYYEVADRKFFQNAAGECLPSRIETGEVKITKSRPSDVFNGYIEREGIEVDRNYGGVPCYIPLLDQIKLNPYIKGEENAEDKWFSVAFHEAGHSTGAKMRLNREGVAKVDPNNEDQYAQEEVIAEICCCLCCAETGIYDFKTSGMDEYDNNIAYVQSWKKRIKNWGSKFVFLVSQADKAFNYICGDPDSSIPESSEE